MQITLDGTAEHHNIRRQHYQHKKTFDKIFENILLALSRNIRIVVRINTDEHTINDIANLKKNVQRQRHTQPSETIYPVRPFGRLYT